MTTFALLTVIALLGGCMSDGESRCQPGPTPVTVVETEVRDHYVRLELEYGGGCGSHEFAVWWSGIAAPSDPPQVPFEFQHYSDGDPCDGLLRSSLWVDLSPVHRTYGGNRALIDFVMGNGAAGQHLTRIDYTFAAPAPAPAADVLTVDESCGVIGR